jgi:hypothetical protein
MVLGVGDGVVLEVGDGILLGVSDGVLVEVGDGMLLGVSEGVLVEVGHRALVDVGDGELSRLGDGRPVAVALRPVSGTTAPAQETSRPPSKKEGVKQILKSQFTRVAIYPRLE